MTRPGDVRAAAGLLNSGGARASCATADPARRQHDNQHQEKEPAKTTPQCRAAQVETAAAEQQYEDYQENQ
jgi:hypothetical protein